MASPIDNLWTEVVAEEEDAKEHQRSVEDSEPTIIYRRRKADVIPQKDLARMRSNSTSSTKESRKSIVLVKRVSWNRSLSTRGRTSIAANAYVDQPKQRKPRRDAKLPLATGKGAEAPNYDKERAYFQEVDAFELLEESPSPKKPVTWSTGSQVHEVAIPHLSSVLRKWLISKKLNRAYAFPGSLAKILESPALSPNLITPAMEYPEVRLTLDSSQQRIISSLSENPLSSIPIEETCEDLEVAVSKLSLTSQPSSLDSHASDSLSALLNACGQLAPSTLTDMLSSYCGSENITKVGEGTYGEAFKVGDNVFKIVPFDGDLPVNGEVQKVTIVGFLANVQQAPRANVTLLYNNSFVSAYTTSLKSEELLEEVVLSCTLNHLRGLEGDVANACTSFIKTTGSRVCQGCYDSALVRAWEDWDAKNNSDNYNPKEFSSDQYYVVFVQEHGGKDLESFVLLNYNEARSLLMQVTLALAVAEAAYEFEHRDLHWGNILLSRKESASLQFILEGKKLEVKTFGLVVSIIDFTLSRINTGEDILFLDLSSDPELFEGRKGDKQADTYRDMRDVTDECWEGSFPKTNVLWLQYLVDILLLKKSFDITDKDKRELRYLKKRLSNFDSAKECVSDPFFSDLFMEVEEAAS